MIKFGMKVPEIFAQLVKGYRKVTGRDPEGLDLIKIKQESLKIFQDMNKVVDIQTGKSMDPSKPIVGGSQEFASGIMKAMKTKPKEVKEVQKRIDSGVASAVEKILRIDPIDAMKEANLVIGRKGPYKNLTQEDAKKILDAVEDKLKNIDMDPEDMLADGGVAGLLGERSRYQRGGDVAYDAADKDIFGSSAISVTPETIFDGFGNQVQAEMGNTYNPPLIEDVIEEKKKIAEDMPSKPVNSLPGIELTGIVGAAVGPNNPVSIKYKGENMSVSQGLLNAYREAVEGARKKRKDGFMGQIMLPGEMSFEDFSSQYNLTYENIPDGSNTMLSKPVNSFPFPGRPLPPQAVEQANDLQGEPLVNQIQMRMQQRDVKPDHFRKYAKDVFDTGGYPSKTLAQYAKEAGVKNQIGVLQAAGPPLQAAGGTGGLPELDIPALGGNNNQMGILPVMPVDRELVAKFADGGRIGFKKGMDRRTFMKIMGGLTTIPVLGKFAKGVKLATPAVTKAAELTGPALAKIVETVMDFGKLISVKGRRVKEMVTKKKYKDIEVEEDIGDRSFIIKKDNKEIYYKPGRMDETGSVEEDIIEVLEDTVTKKAGGGIARMLGE